jgi:hypothetical protein
MLIADGETMKPDGSEALRPKWRRRLFWFRKLSWRMRMLIFASFVLMGPVRCAILLIPFRYIAPMLGKKNGSSSTDVKHETLVKAARIGWAVETVSRFTPWESKCLVRAITAQILLRGIGTPSTLYLGMAKDKSSQLIAHAWLRCGNLVLTGASESDNFRNIAQFASLTDKENLRDNA